MAEPEIKLLELWLILSDFTAQTTFWLGEHKPFIETNWRYDDSRHQSNVLSLRGETWSPKRVLFQQVSDQGDIECKDDIEWRSYVGYEAFEIRMAESQFVSLKSAVYRDDVEEARLYITVEPEVESDHRRRLNFVELKLRHKTIIVGDSSKARADISENQNKTTDSILRYALIITGLLLFIVIEIYVFRK